jgi:hypothetical protein
MPDLVANNQPHAKAFATEPLKGELEVWKTCNCQIVDSDDHEHLHNLRIEFAERRITKTCEEHIEQPHARSRRRIEIVHNVSQYLISWEHRFPMLE